MNMKKNKKRMILVCIVLLLLLCGGIACRWHLNDGSPYYLEVMELGDCGYGYKIYEGERMIIVQPFIPAVAGKRTFRAEQDARRVGHWVMERIEAGSEFAISKTDLDDLGITY